MGVLSSPLHGPPILIDRLVSAAERARSITFVTGSDGPVTVSYRQLHDESMAMAASFQAMGVQPGHHVAILGPTTRQLVTAIQATWLAGAAAVVLPLPMRLGSLDEFVEATRVRILASESVLVVVDPDLAAFVDRQADDPPLVSFADLAVGCPGHLDAARWVRPVVAPTNLAILQFTSGSTADPKGVMLPHAQVCANVDAIAAGARLDPDVDVLVSWLPLYHDMGLIGLLTLPMTTGTDLVLAAPQDFIASPGRWLQWISDYRGTATAGPNFSYALAARAMTRMEGIDLSSWRLGLNGAEPVDPSAVESFIAAGARHGLRADSVFPAFGMAEACVAVAFPAPGSGLQVDIVDKQVLETNGYAAPVLADAPHARRLAKLGAPVQGLELRIVDLSDGHVMEEREVGELQVRGTSVTAGYFRRPDATEAAFDGEWLRTGDLAYLVDGQLVVCGRIKDMIIVGGRNVFPEDVERALTGIDGVRVGNVIAFGMPRAVRAREGLVVVAEVRVDADHERVRSDVSRRVRETVGFAPDDIVLVSPGTLPKTSSGKLQRTACRTQFLGATLSLV
jgi:fatty-acyl-CoA synthase